MKKKFSKWYLIFFVLIIIIGVLGYFGYRLEKRKQALEKDLLQTKADFASTTQNLNLVIDFLNQSLATTTAERNDFQQKYIGELARMNLLDVKIQGIEGVVSMLEKLQKTDKELLMKYSKVYFLNENYIPETLVKINPEYTYYPENDFLFSLGALSYLEDLINVGKGAGVDLKIISAYRSFGTQAAIKARHNIIYGSDANSFSADQGYSEHQLGTTVDFTTLEVGSTFSSFEETPDYQWLLNNAHKYGFILSYPQSNQYYQFEPWHWRFVGRELAGILYQQGKNFYDFDQREIDKYLVNFFD
jgi:D-alanyl-D-alanine carboxypeptidase